MAELQRGPRGWERTRVGAAPPAPTAPSRSLCRRLGAVLALCTSHICWGCGCQPRECLLAPSVTTRGRSDITQRDDRATSIEKSFGAEDTGKGGRDPNGRQLLAPRTPTSPPLCSLPGSAPGERRPPCGGSRNPGHRGPACPRGRAAWYPETWQPPADSPAAHHLYLGRAWQVEKEPGFSVDPGAGPAGYTLSRNCMRGGPPAPPGKSPIMGLRTGPLRGARPMGHGSMESGQDPFSPSEPPAWERGLCLSQTSLSY